MRNRVKIVGGGLTGILAAFQAHRLGVRDIELHERFERLGGAALSDERHGLEMRERCIYFGGKGDPIRDLLEAYGPTFEDFDNAFGSVSPNPSGPPLHIEDFSGPALPCRGVGLAPPAGPSLAHRLAAYPPELKTALMRYARWHLGGDLREVHASAAVPMGINRVFPLGANLAALAEAKRHDPVTDAFYGIPRALWGRTENLQASLPTGGFPTFLRRCRLALEAIGVSIHDQSLVSPRQALLEQADDEVLVWAASPTPLFKVMGMPTPRLLPKTFANYVFAANWTGPRPFYVQNFTAEGACFRVSVYESAGQTLLTAECVSEASAADLRYDIHRLLKGFDGDLALGDLLFMSIKPRWDYHGVAAVEALARLRATMASRLGPSVVPGAWESFDKAERFAQVNAALAAGLGLTARSEAA